MKIYEYRDFPNPRRVRIFLAEKGVTGIDFEQVDIANQEHRKSPFLAMNPYAGLPVLELGDGTHIAETVAISRYFEETHPGPMLMGSTPAEKAHIEMWQRRAEETVLNPLLAYFHHTTPGLGPLETYQNRDWGLNNRDRAVAAMALLDRQINGHTYLTGTRFTIADITAQCAIDLAGALDLEVPGQLVNLRRWHERVSARPSAAA